MSREQDDRQTAIHLAHTTRTRAAPLGDWAMPVSRKATTYAACKNGPCRQGRGICPTPIGCRMAQNERGPWARFLDRVLKLFRSRK